MDAAKIPEIIHLPVADEVHVWTVILSENRAAIADFERLLSGREQLAAARFLRLIDRERYIVAHGILRKLLGRYLDMEPTSVVFEVGQQGKPALVLGSGRPPISFNMAHSGDVILYAIARGRQVGIDVEAIRSDRDVMELAESQFSRDEVEALRLLEPAERIEAFYRCWTLKEAYIKARGEGLSYPLKDFAVTVGKQVQPAIRWAADDPQVTERWTVYELAPGPGYKGALVVEGRPVRLVE